jgi:hypothetical protein
MSEQEMQALRAAAIASLGRHTGRPPSDGGTACPLGPATPIEDGAIGVSIAALLGGAPAELTDEQVQQFRSWIEAEAARQAAILVQYLDALVAHFLSLGLKASDVPAYIAQRGGTLASLYFLVAQPNPSPGELKKLALRYALDARRQIEGNIGRFTWSRTDAGWIIGEYPSVTHRGMPFPASSRLVNEPFAVRLLDCVFADPPLPHKLLETVETILGAVPQPGDSLEEADLPRFWYAIEGQREKERVRLWINDREVLLSTWQDVHRLLAELCRNPHVELVGRQTVEQFGITNASQAVSKIKNALKAAFPSAEDWLLTNPIRWAPGWTPVLRAPNRG